jgi:aldehyde:ferredoxin oxidoreductase
MGLGYMGKILVVDLTTGRIHSESVPDSVYDQFLSGAGLAAWYLYRQIPPGADPLGPENVLGFVSGTLTGTGSLFTGRWMVVGKSPLTGCWGEANCGGTLAPAIKQCGYDAIFFSGISPRPVYLFADGNTAELRDAADLWGLDTVATENRLVRAHAGKKRPRIACIGPAGERLALIAGVVNDGGRLAARAGLGAVMGAKRLKAVALAGSQRVKVGDRETVLRLSREVSAIVQSHPPFVSGKVAAYMGRLMRALPAQMETDGLLFKMILHKWGTVGMNQMSIEMGDAPVRNWGGTHSDFDLEKSAAVSPDVFTRPVVAKYFCYSCPLGCGALIEGAADAPKSHRPEYETATALGALCINSDAASIFHMNEMLNRAGMDSISAGATIAFAMECYQNGLITRADTDGIDLTWGNSDAMVALLDKMIRREGIGDLLADGSRMAARRIGRSSDRFAMHAGGQDLPMHDSRFDPGFALHYAVEPAPGRHTVGSLLYYEMFQLWRRIQGLPDPSRLYLKGSKYHAYPEKARMGVACSQFVNLLNAAGACLFGAFLGVHRLPIFQWLDAVCGRVRTPAAYLEIGARIQTVCQAFNFRQGIEAQALRVSDRALGRPPQSSGANTGRTVPIEALVADYFEQSGWDRQTGRPPEAALRELGL